jgi:ubiquinone/menaquinone biosynthesis methyltransferase
MDSDFGYQKISIDTKKEKVNSIFAEVAPYYDVMNDAMTLGLHRFWKKYFVELIDKKNLEKVIDLASGTGDIVFEMIEQEVAKHYIAIDPNKKMLDHAKLRAAHEQVYKNRPDLRLEWIVAYGEDLSVIGDDTIDLVTCAYGFRNVSDRIQCLKEIYRVLKKGSNFLMLEFSHVDSPYDQIYNLYRDKVLPSLGHFLFNDKDSYQYLADSIAVFWDEKKCLEALTEAGFVNVQSTSIMKGISRIYQGTKPYV